METIDALRAAAEAGDYNAMYYLGAAYALGKDVEQNDEKAFKWYSKAALRNAEAAYNLAMMYKNGNGTAPDAEKAQELFCFAAEKGVAAAAFNAGMIYLRKGECEKASSYFRQAAESGLPEAQHNYGIACVKGDGVEANGTEAVKWLEKAAAQGNRESMRYLGRIYLTGSGIDRNSSKAAEWYKRAGDNLADIIEKSEEDTECSFRLAAFLDENPETACDLSEACRLYLKASENGHVSASAALGRMYEWGRGVEKNCVDAVKYYKIAAEAGDAAAMHDLASMYALGNGVDQDYEEAVKWSENAALCGYAPAAYALGLAYRDGWGVEVNEEKSYQWFLKGAELNNADSQYETAIILSRKGEEKEAMIWITRAAEQGHLGAMMALRERQ